MASFDNMIFNVLIACSYEDGRVDIRLNLSNRNKGIYYSIDTPERFFEELIDFLAIYNISSFDLVVYTMNKTFKYETSRMHIIKALNESKTINKSSINNLENLMNK